MAHRYANMWSQTAAGLTAMAHTRASAFRWGVVILLTIVWIGGGLFYWLSNGEDIAQAIDAANRRFTGTLAVRGEPRLVLARIAPLMGVRLSKSKEGWVLTPIHGSPH